MKTVIIFAIMLLTGVSGVRPENLFPQQDIDSISTHSFRNRIDENPAVFSKNNHIYHTEHTLPVQPCIEIEEPTLLDIIIGDEPAETLLITGPWTHIGNIYIIGDGVLRFTHARSAITGNIVVMNTGKLLADSSFLGFEQECMYQHNILITDSAEMTVQACTTDFGGYSKGVVVRGESRYTLTNVFFNDWTATWLFDKGKANLRNINNAGEYLISDSSDVEFNQIDSLLIWFYYTDGCDISFTYPDDSLVCDFTFSDSVPGIDNVGYQVAIDSCQNVSWAILPMHGCNATIDSSHISIIGILMMGNDTLVVKDLNNFRFYTDYITPISDRYLRLVDTYVNVWAAYSGDSSYAEVCSCTIFDIETWDESKMVGYDFEMDGYGKGSIMTMESSTAFFSNAIINGRVLCRNSSYLAFANSSIDEGWIQAFDSSTVLLVGSSFIDEPVAFDCALAWVTSIDSPSTAFVDTTIDIFGSAWLDAGPLNPTTFDRYKLYWAFPGDSVWTLIVDSIGQVHSDIIAKWNTSGLSVGEYDLRLTSWDSEGDSLTAIKSISLSAMGIAVENNFPEYVDINVFPNPFNSSCVITAPAGAEIEIYDLLGNPVWSEIIPRSGPAEMVWTPDKTIPSGIYLVKATMEDGNFVTKRILLIK